MKGTFDDGSLKFTIFYAKSQSKKLHKVNFNDVYGVGIHSYIRSNNITNINLFSKKKKSKTAEVAFFPSIPVYDDCLTFEEAIERYLTSECNYKHFNDVEKNHALCFLERYCMKYSDTKEIKKSYVKSLKR